MKFQLSELNTQIKHPQIRERGLEYFDYRSNLIVDENNPILIQKAWRDRFSGPSFWKEGKEGGKAYLGVKHGEDALTWNVFRSLQREGQKGCQVISRVLGLSQIDKILFWGCDVESNGEEQQLLSILIRATDGKLKGTMTEPDLVLIADAEVAFVECKLNQSGNQSPWRARQVLPGKEGGSAKRMEVYKRVGVDGLDQIEDRIKDWQDVYQLIRQYVYANLLADALEKEPVVIPLVNEEHLKALAPIYCKLKESSLNKTGIFRAMVTWQEFLPEISRQDLECGAKLKGYMLRAFEASEKYGKRAPECV